MRNLSLSLLCLLVFGFLLAGCPGRTKRNVGPVLIEVPSNSNAQAKSRFESGRQVFQQDGSVDNSETFESIIKDYPNDPIVPHALLYAAMADLRAQDATSALQKLDELLMGKKAKPALLVRGRLVRGFALIALDRVVESLSDLNAGSAALDSTNPEEKVAFHSALAEANRLTDNPMESVLHYDAWWRIGTESERIYVLAKVQELAPTIPINKLLSLKSRLQKPDGIAVAVLGMQFVAALEEANRSEDAKILLATLPAIQEQAGTGKLWTHENEGNADILGALLPLSGRLNRIGELSLRGLMLASGKFAGASKAAGEFTLVARDTSSGLKRVREEAMHLVRGEAVALIGPFDGNAVMEAKEVATNVGIPVIALSPRGKSGGGVFAIRHSAEDRARFLAQHAVKTGVKEFAILAPLSSYGRVVGKAFENEVVRLGAKVTVSVQYKSGTTSFKKDIARMKKRWSAVFVPDIAKNLMLIAPALASANFYSRPQGKRSKRGRSILLLSTAEGVEAGYLRAAGRYSLGAVFAPGFYPDRTDARIAEFVGRYEEQYGKEPSSHEAFAFDAAMVVRFAIQRGATNRKGVRQALQQQSVSALTGEIQFSSTGERVDGGLLFEVREPIDGQYELKALR